MPIFRAGAKDPPNSGVAIAWYSGPGDDAFNAPLDNPIGIHFHSDFRYPQPIIDQEITVVPPRVDNAFQDYAWVATLPPVVLLNHGRSSPPLIMGVVTGYRSDWQAEQNVVGKMLTGTTALEWYQPYWPYRVCDLFVTDTQVLLQFSGMAWALVEGSQWEMDVRIIVLDEPIDASA